MMARDQHVRLPLPEELDQGRHWRWDEDARRNRIDGEPRTEAALRPGDLPFVDEAGMLDQDTARALVTIADEHSVRIAFTDDRHQLRPSAAAAASTPCKTASRGSAGPSLMLRTRRIRGIEGPGIGFWVALLDSFGGAWSYLCVRPAVTAPSHIWDLP
jgi:hypothetical protein